MASRLVTIPYLTSFSLNDFLGHCACALSSSDNSCALCFHGSCLSHIYGLILTVDGAIWTPDGCSIFPLFWSIMTHTGFDGHRTPKSTVKVFCHSFRWLPFRRKLPPSCAYAYILGRRLQGGRLHAGMVPPSISLNLTNS